MNHSLRLLVVELQVHAVVDLVVLQLDVVLEDGVPLLQDDLVPLGASLGCKQTGRSLCESTAQLSNP